MSSEIREVAHDQHSHPGPKKYFAILVILAVITAVEVGLFYAEQTLGSGLVRTLLVILSTAKFVIVVAYYMHLKYDSRIFTGIFLFPLALGALVVAGLYTLFQVLDQRVGG